MKKYIFLMLVILMAGLIGVTMRSPSMGERPNSRVGSSSTDASVGQANPNPPSAQSPNIGALISVPTGGFQRDAAFSNISTVSAFHMSQYEITRAQFTSVTGLSDPSDERIADGNSDSPAQNITWYHTLVFCNRLSMKEGLMPVYEIAGSTDPAEWGPVPVRDNAVWNQVTANWNANGYRLPTEAEWLWAAMGADIGNAGQINIVGINKRFTGDGAGQTLNAYAWYSGNSAGTAQPVGTKKPNELGFYDISGNVWEWCWDRYDRLPEGGIVDYRGSAGGTDRVLHGGSWRNETDRIALAFRLNHYPSFQYPNIGFRVVRQ